VDRPLDSAIQRKEGLTRIVKGVVPIVALVLLIVWLPGFIRPSVNRQRVRTAKVTTGPIEAVISASGTIVPETERALSSPVDARVIRILKRPGDALKAGDPLVELDANLSVLAVEKLQKDLAVKDNEQTQTRLTLEKSLLEIEGKLQTQTLELAATRAELAENRHLFKDGLISQDKLRQSELTEAKALIELKQLEGQRDNIRQSNDVKVEGLKLEREALGKETAEARRQLELTTTRADRDGVVTWALPEEGATVRRGDVIARIADLRTFRVDANVSDVHAKNLVSGMPVVIRVNDDDALAGRVSAILPKIENGIITFRVALDDRSHQLLRPNLRVDVLVVTDRRPRALRLRKGPFSEGDGFRQAFVIRGDRAVRTPIALGLVSFDDYEVVNGLVEGDEVIISDMRDYLHLPEVRFK
jgi:HlyD family secretion protein